jgi:hypothetical protein
MSDQKDINQMKVEVDPSTLKPEQKKIMEEIAAEEAVEKKEEIPAKEEKKPDQAEAKAEVEEKEEPETEDEDEEKERPVRAIPIAKYQDEKKKWRDKETGYKSQIEDLQQKASQGKDTANDIDGIIEEFPEVNRSFLEKVVSVAEARAAKKAQLSPDIEKKLAIFEQERLEKHQNKMFKTELAKLKEEYPDEEIDKDKLKEMAFLEGYENKSLYELHFRHLKPKQAPKKKTAEAGRGGANRGETIDFEDPNLDFDSMSDQQWQAYKAYWKKKTGSALKII